MNVLRLNSHRKTLLLTLSAFLLVLALSSFTVQRYRDDFLKQLGITKTEADERISSSLFGGFLNSSGMKTAKSIMTGDRAAVTTDLLVYVKNFVRSADFKTKYAAFRLENKPALNYPQTPADMRKEQVETLRKSIEETEANMKKTTGETRQVLQDMIADMKKQLEAAQDPANPMFRMYEDNYKQLVEEFEQSSAETLQGWKEQYPESPERYVSVLLKQFLEETEKVDFDAELTSRNGKKYFVNPAYERRNNHWKMAFRAGRDVVIPARAFVQAWLKEIN